MIALVKLLAGVILGAVGSVLGNEVYSSCPRLAYWFIGKAAAWHPADERRDFIDETTDYIDSFLDDGMRLSAATIAASEYLSAALSLGVPAWLHRATSEADAKVASAVCGGLYGLVLTQSGFAGIALCWIPWFATTEYVREWTKQALAGLAIGFAAGFVTGRLLPASADGAYLVACNLLGAYLMAGAVALVRGAHDRLGPDVETGRRLRPAGSR